MCVVAVLLAVLSSPTGSTPWLLTSAPPAERAARLLRNMSLDDKVRMLHGNCHLNICGVFPKGSIYTGHVLGNQRLGIPPLNLNDGPQGFRDGGSTCWPSGMTVGMTWDEALAERWGAAMGKEFFDKGANIQLGPGMCLARVPLNGRNFEYVSGEDPVLGKRMVAPVIRGIQSQGVIANAKHWVLNSQETKRSTIDDVADERTRFEMYYPPFEGAIAAGVGSVMCSYNKVNGRWSCENNSTLATDLKERLGFKGFVMSDWGATHSTSINEGLDQEMSGGLFFHQALKLAVTEGRVAVAKVDESVTRILIPMFEMGLFENAQQWNNASRRMDDVTSPAHSALAREISAAAMTLLKNDGRILPLRSGTKLAVIGAEAKHPTVHGGGSGLVTPTYVSAPYDAILARNPNATEYDDGTEPSRAADVAAAADVAVIFIGATSAEGFDRKSLSFADGADALVDAVAAVQPKTVVVGVNPGAVLLPWADAVNAIILAGVPGLEYGRATADVLFGDVNPSGRLTLTVPNKENEVGFTPSMYPGVHGISNYTERLNVGYRWYNSHQVEPKFPFGHGLSYTRFEYSGLTASSTEVCVTVRNGGALPGAEVVQVYLTFPAAAGEPPMQLKAFNKTAIITPGAAIPVKFALSPRDFSVWNPELHGWTQVSGNYTVSVGASLRDIRGTMLVVISAGSSNDIGLVE